MEQIISTRVGRKCFTPVTLMPKQDHNKVILQQQRRGLIISGSTFIRVSCILETITTKPYPTRLHGPHDTI